MVTREVSGRERSRLVLDDGLAVALLHARIQRSRQLHLQGPHCLASLRQLALAERPLLLQLHRRPLRFLGISFQCLQVSASQLSQQFGNLCFVLLGLDLQALEPKVGREALADLLPLPTPLLLGLEPRAEAVQLALRVARRLVGGGELGLQRVRVFHAAPHDVDGLLHLREGIHFALHGSNLRIASVQLATIALAQLCPLLPQLPGAGAGRVRLPPRAFRRLRALPEVRLPGGQLGVHVPAPRNLRL
mmetsp:Transcript_86382/g.268378  ORF Transcript_86382/g.268378 Transcript_86382/m.268378 type:complete len:247 (-) Transcript_86382:188-928(-)